MPVLVLHRSPLLMLRRERERARKREREVRLCSAQPARRGGCLVGWDSWLLCLWVLLLCRFRWERETASAVLDDEVVWDTREKGEA